MHPEIWFLYLKNLDTKAFAFLLQCWLNLTSEMFLRNFGNICKWMELTYRFHSNYFDFEKTSQSKENFGKIISYHCNFTENNLRRNS